MQRCLRIGTLAAQASSSARSCASHVQASRSATVMCDVAGPSTLWRVQQSIHTSSYSRAKQVDAQPKEPAMTTNSVAADAAHTSTPESGGTTTGEAAVESNKAASAKIPESNSDFAELDKLPLPYLSAPLGVSKRPTSKPLSWIEKRDMQFDDSLRLQRRKAIVKEATRGYFHDVHAMRSHGGKTWIAPSTLIRQDRALFFPAISGVCLSDKQKRNTADMLPGKVSVICVMTSQVSEKHAESFHKPTYDVYKNDANFQLVQINLQENLLKAALVSLFASSLRKTIPAQLQSTYMLTSQDLTMERDQIALHNKHVGYTFLVGPDGKIRWAGCAFAERAEAQALIACTGVLLSRLAEDKGN